MYFFQIFAITIWLFIILVLADWVAGSLRIRYARWADRRRKCKCGALAIYGVISEPECSTCSHKRMLEYQKDSAASTYNSAADFVKQLTQDPEAIKSYRKIIGLQSEREKFEEDAKGDDWE